jgi:hypothetical protein
VAAAATNYFGSVNGGVVNNNVFEWNFANGDLHMVDHNTDSQLYYYTLNFLLLMPDGTKKLVRFDPEIQNSGNIGDTGPGGH